MNAQRLHKKRGAASLYRAIDEQSALDDLEEISAMSDAELDRVIAEGGGDPAAIRASGHALVDEVQDRQRRLGWHKTMDAKLQRVRAEAIAATARRVRLPRAEILTRIEAARRDPRFSAPVSALFQKKSAEASTDDELAILLAQIELLATLDEP